MEKGINVRSIHVDELDHFGNAGQKSDFWDRFRARRKLEWAEGRSSPEMCFVAEIDDEIVGRLVFSGDIDLSLGFFEVSWGQDDYILFGKELLQKSCVLLFERGHQSVSLQVGNNIPNSEKRRQVLQSAAIGLRREKVIFTAPNDVAPVTTLHFEGLENVGRDTFVEAIIQVNEGCLDIDVREKYEAANSAADKRSLAQEQFDSFGEGYEGKERLWELAFHNDKCIGLSMPGLFPKDKPDDPVSGTICYIGVIADQRGNRYGREILLRLTKKLYEVGAEHVWADTESTNAPMISTFIAADWQETGRNFQYRANLKDVGM